MPNMKLLLMGALSATLAATCLASSSTGLSILPAPQKMVAGEGSITLAPDTHIYTDEASRETGEYLASQLRRPTGYPFETGVNPRSEAIPGAILITTAGAKADLGAEGYELTVAPDSIVIRAPQQAGCFYGVQTLLQLLPPEIFASQALQGMKWTVPSVRIEDRPRFAWRGMMLDVSRHFFNKEEVKKVLDILALHKINTFHWHLVDSQGWRIEIKKYPRLTENGAWRKDILFGLDPKSSTAYGPDGRYGGFYTQDDIREIISYAAARHITIVPEIEMPGHSGAALDTYPELACDKPGNSAPSAKSPVAYCAGKEEVFDFLQNVLTEVTELFPGKYLHIGGDEVKKDAWKQCDKCQARIKAEGLKDEEELQSYFIRRMEKFVTAKGRKLVGWSEILEGGLPESATVMDWIGGAEKAAAAGHDVVMSSNADCYFNFPQSQERSLEPPAQNRFLPLHRVYAYEPVPEKPDPKFRPHILGTEGCLWTEYIPSLKHLEYMMLPRLSALAEVDWSPKADRDWGDFNRRLQSQYQRFDQLGVSYRRETAAVIGGWTPSQITEQNADLEWDATGQISAPGNYSISIDQIRGKTNLKISQVALFENGREIVCDTHDGESGNKPHNAFYKLELPKYNVGAHYTIRARVAGGHAGDSAGHVTLRLQSPDEKQEPTVIGEWTPEQVPAQKGTWEWDVTRSVQAAGSYRANATYIRGKNSLEITAVALLEDGKEIVRDSHPGIAGRKPQDTEYTLEIPQPKAGAKYTVRAEVSGRGGTDSFGKVFWSTPPRDLSQKSP